MRKQCTNYLRSLATFSYLTDSYEQYGSSAIGEKKLDINHSSRFTHEAIHLAAQSFLRNVFAYVHYA